MFRPSDPRRVTQTDTTLSLCSRFVGARYAVT